MIFAKTRYETHNGKFLAIVKAFKIWRYYLENCKYKMLVLTNYNNLCHFIDIKNLSLRQVCWAQKLSSYYFQINYCKDKANIAANVLSKFSQKNQKKENEFQTKNSQIFHYLQNSLTNTSLARLSLPSFLLSHLYQVFIYGIYILSQLRYF